MHPDHSGRRALHREAIVGRGAVEPALSERRDVEEHRTDVEDAGDFRNLSGGRRPVGPREQIRIPGFGDLPDVDRGRNLRSIAEGCVVEAITDAECGRDDLMVFGKQPGRNIELDIRLEVVKIRLVEDVQRRIPLADESRQELVGRIIDARIDDELIGVGGNRERK